MKDDRPFFILPRELALTPPIRHRNGSKETDLTPFEFAILAGVIREACDYLAHQRHKAARAAGASAIAKEKEYDDAYKQDWVAVRKRRRQEGRQVSAPQRRYTFSDASSSKPMPLGKAIRRAGETGYGKIKLALKKEPLPKSIPIESLSTYALLQEAELLDSGINLSRVPAALDRLCCDVGNLPPLLHSWRRLKTGNLSLEVAGHWLSPPWVKIYLPMPLRSPAALALHLFVASIKFGSFAKGKMKFVALCERLGVPTRYSSRSINNAIDVLNKHNALCDEDSEENIVLKGWEDGYVQLRRQAKELDEEAVENELVEDQSS